MNWEADIIIETWGRRFHERSISKKVTCFLDVRGPKTDDDDDDDDNDDNDDRQAIIYWLLTLCQA